MMRSWTPSHKLVGCRPESRARRSRRTPRSTSNANEQAGGMDVRVSALSSASTAGLAQMATQKKVRVQMPTSETLCASTSGWVSA